MRGPGEILAGPFHAGVACHACRTAPSPALGDNGPGRCPCRRATPAAACCRPKRRAGPASTPGPAAPFWPGRSRLNFRLDESAPGRNRRQRHFDNQRLGSGRDGDAAVAKAQVPLVPVAELPVERAFQGDLGECPDLRPELRAAFADASSMPPSRIAARPGSCRRSRGSGVPDCSGPSARRPPAGFRPPAAARGSCRRSRRRTTASRGPAVHPWRSPARLRR